MATKIVKDNKHPDRLCAVCPDGSLSGDLFAVDPSGHLVSVPAISKLKAGWKWATEADVKKADDAAAKQIAAEKKAG